MTDSHNGLEHFGNMIAYHDLILAAGLHDRYYSVCAGQDIGIGFSFVLEVKAKPCDAVSYGVNVSFAAHVLQYDMIRERASYLLAIR